MKAAVLILALALSGCAAIGEILLSPLEPAFEKLYDKNFMGFKSMDRKMDEWTAEQRAIAAQRARPIVNPEKHIKHAKKRCACTTRAWKKCLPVHTIGTPEHEACVDDHLEVDSHRGLQHPHMGGKDHEAYNWYR